MEEKMMIMKLSQIERSVRKDIELSPRHYQAEVKSGEPTMSRADSSSAAGIPWEILTAGGDVHQLFAPIMKMVLFSAPNDEKSVTAVPNGSRRSPRIIIW